LMACLSVLAGDRSPVRPYDNDQTWRA
jgi:hypothetical protein